MRKTTEVMSVKDFMDRNYHMDALGAMLGIMFMLLLPAYYIAQFVPPAASIAFKAAPLIIML